MTLRFALVSFFLVALAACGSSRTAGDAGGSDSGGGDSGGGDSGRTDGGGGGGVCPASLPAAGASCSREGLVCQYGDDPRIACRPTATCTSGSFVVNDPDCPPIAMVMCPATREAAAGQLCTPMDAICAYDGLACVCTNCEPGPAIMCSGDPTWHCQAPHADPACPAAMPNSGTSCSGTPEGKECQYDCEAGMGRRCEGGVWVPYDPPGGCPISSRRAKRDIAYLDADDVDALAAEALRTRLATYEYVDPGLAGRRRLGFILEDQGASYSVDPERSQIDLYGYTSILLAAVQAQERRIAELERRIAEARGDGAARAICSP